jgi:hypothetical protein
MTTSARAIHWPQPRLFAALAGSRRGAAGRPGRGYLRPRWSLPAVAALAATPAALAAAGEDQVLDRYFAQNTVFWALTMGVLIGLARVAARLRASQQELVGSAVIAERVRIDDELSARLGAELEQLIAAGQRAAQAAADDPASPARTAGCNHRYHYLDT